MSCSSFKANMFRLFLYGAAYVTAYRLKSKAFSNTEVEVFTMDSFMKRIMLSAVFYGLARFSSLNDTPYE